MNEEFTMNRQEVDRVQVISQLSSQFINQRKAAEILGLSVRQVQRLLVAFRKDEAKGLLSKRKGRPSLNRLLPMIRTKINKILTIEEYHDFGPTMLCEMLQLRHGIKISVETTRKIMIEEKNWTCNKTRRPKIHQPRARKDRVGELVQIDGSPHDWFEDRGPRCTLIVYIDDATSALLNILFTPSETTAAYFKSTEEHIKTHGRPITYYSDKDSIFRDNKKRESGEPRRLTQFGRAMKTLNILQICAGSPQAKGRVERANRTLQDRIVKLLRLMKISSIEKANEKRGVLIQYYNERFAVPPICKEDAHRPRLVGQDLDLILTCQYPRKLSKQLTVKFRGKIVLIKIKNATFRMRGAGVTICEANDEIVAILYKGRKLEFEVLEEKDPAYQELGSSGKVLEIKEFDQMFEQLLEQQKKDEHALKSFIKEIKEV